MAITAHKQIDIYGLTSGLNTMKSSVLLGKDEIRDCQDIDLFPIGGFSKRNGYTPLNPISLNYPCLGLYMARYSTAGGTNIFYSVFGTGINSMPASLNGVWTSITGGLSITNNANYIWTFDILNDICVASNGVDAPIQLSSAGAATAFPGGLPFTKYLFACQSRGYMFYFVPLVGADVKYDRGYFSDLNTPLTVGANNYVDVFIGQGGDIRGALDYRTSLYVWKRSGIYQLNFQPTQIDSSGTLFPWTISPNPIVPGVGTMSHRSIVKFTTPTTHTTPGIEYVFFVDQFGVPRVFDGSTTISLGSKINSSRDSTILSLSNMDRNRTQYSFSINYPEKNKILFFLSSTGSQQNQCWVMDYNVGFSIYRYKYNLPFNTGYLFEKSDGTYKPYVGDYLGQAHQLDQGTTDNGMPINDYLRSPDVFTASPAIRNKWFNIYLRGKTGSSSQNVKVSYYIDGNDTPVKVSNPLSLGHTNAKWGAGTIWGHFKWATSGIVSRSMEINLESKTLSVRIESNDKANDTYNIEGFSLEGMPTGTSEN